MSDKKIKIFGWAKTIRDSKKIGFIELNDGTSIKNCQVVFKPDIANYDEIIKQGVGTSFTIIGELILTPKNKQPFEILAEDIIIEGESPVDYPLQKKEHSMEFLREIAYLRPRTKTFNAVFRVRSVAAFAIHNFFNSKNFLYVHTPIITTSDSEGVGAMFQVTTLDMKKGKEVDYTNDFFGEKANLTVSGQLNGECFAMGFSNIYTFGPTFRAEKSNTTRHAAEFWMIEPEMAYYDLYDLMDLEEEMLKYVINYCLKECHDELEFLNSNIDDTLLSRLKSVVENEFVRLSYTEGIKILEKVKDKFKFPVYWGCDLQSEHERYLTEEVYKKPVFLYDYPKEIKAFYMKLNKDKKTVAAVDLLIPKIGELMGGSQREDSYEILDKKLEELKMDKEKYWWYLNLRKYGTVKHSGFGLGFERLIMYLTGMENIRDVLPFPRTVGNAKF